MTFSDALIDCIRWKGFGCRLEALNWLYLVPVNGYEWREGELGSRPHSPQMTLNRARLLSEQKELALFYPVCGDSAIWVFPPNIKTDWFEGGIELAKICTTLRSHTYWEWFRAQRDVYTFRALSSDTARRELFKLVRHNRLHMRDILRRLMAHKRLTKNQIQIA